MRAAPAGCYFQQNFRRRCSTWDVISTIACPFPDLRIFAFWSNVCVCARVCVWCFINSSSSSHLFTMQRCLKYFGVFWTSTSHFQRRPAARYEVNHTITNFLNELAVHMCSFCRSYMKPESGSCASRFSRPPHAGITDAQSITPLEIDWSD